MEKVVFFVFRDEEMCFIHVLLYALDYLAAHKTFHVVFEGRATRLVPLLAAEDHPLHTLYAKVKAQGGIAGACRACSAKMGVLQDIEKEGIPLLDDMNGHPSVRRFFEEGYTVLLM
ncbi:MAG: cytoplasmic protein [Candidatus Caldatribacterium sp.]|uniref:cytoplasmic protein n=1 Tax=Candidatus Caldatribacterium sp. TaxID=2282143 RepID=UPI00299175E0|nr:cytoplasmic protein [Candidatus Caldatribacterium sp.]MCX7731196.1 cytoplasmic protein [Candidatus Caldatribacterium sp.]MDW8080332.1 cytoplasmic protein [Candidatus Calescibacterium sp.]